MRAGALDSTARAAIADELMAGFADRTGLTTDRSPERYLWTDAFAVRNFLGLGQPERALQLVDQVHHALGRFAPGDRRVGWISGLSGDEAERHPTLGGLRIGKSLPERGPDEPIDERLEWDRDGQYFHYLTQWMHALDAVAVRTGDARFNAWALDLAESAHLGFVYPDAFGRRRMHWKMSVDLTRPLVASMGHHDPLDGLLTCLELDVTAARLARAPARPRLQGQAADYAAMLPADLSTPDPLSIGALLRDALRADELRRAGALDAGLPDRLIADALTSLETYRRSGELDLPASHRLGFRELGLAIGLAGVPALIADATGASARVAEELAAHMDLGDRIEAFWLRPEHRSSAAWLDHGNINDVMLAARLLPDPVARARR